jgi:cytidine deaminase
MRKDTREILQRLARKAWAVRRNAFVIGNTKVGCALSSSSGNIYFGCNVEHKYRCHDVHAEVNALTAMVAAGESSVEIIVIVAEREKFTPCGGCMDWIMQFGGKNAVVAFQNVEDGDFTVFTANELMPHYPI